MNTIPVTRCQPGIYAKNKSQVHRSPSKSCELPLDVNPLSRTSQSLGAYRSSGLQCMPALKSWRPLHVCLAGGKGMMGNNNENSPWESLEKAMQNIKGKSIEDVLREQIEKGEYYQNGSNGGKPPGSGGGGGGGGSSGPGGSEDGRFAGMSDETLQVVLATIGFILLYICVNDGVELAKLTRDFIKYLSGGGQSVRLQRVLYKWVRLYKNMTQKKEVDKDVLESEPTTSRSLSGMSLGN
ncbi:hypothetical protein TanjilG_26691 [Lupinus angustifolius]|uniref:Uncharacterized protein n=1 Tax=Lupinus angustifolius TaxID=3871 RepID=A0A1J7H1A5_LUPAN|nr:PREDICTED: uncharacterized protein LOC109354930 [Lupinus angustifolius]XP_019453306.1 PREDICTED: uncharacterized protein LOC109354930 [Lupinus angustifolius]OIW06502.1 hypothetical protein TanjilG_26691 [Lupinus angustifolius]